MGSPAVICGGRIRDPSFRFGVFSFDFSFALLHEVEERGSRVLFGSRCRLRVDASVGSRDFSGVGSAFLVGERSGRLGRLLIKFGRKGRLVLWYSWVSKVPDRRLILGRSGPCALGGLVIGCRFLGGLALGGVAGGARMGARSL